MGDEAWLRLARFFGTLMLINFAIGVATGLVQEFQFGMNWSIYSEFVGDVFGAPLAIEGLAAFMLESTFLGLWIFGWDRLSKRVHLATIWLFALGSWASAFFIISANSWMQRPVGSTVTDGRAELTDVWELFSNRFGIWAYIHVLLGGAHDGGRRDLRRRLLAPPPRKEPGALPPRRKARIDRRRPDLGGEPRGRQPDGRRGDRLPADEDRRDRGSVGHLPAVRVLALPDRRLHRGRPDAVVLDPGPAGSSPYSPPVRSDGGGAGNDPAPGGGRAEYGAGDYIPPVRTTYWSMRIMAYAGTLVFLVLALGAFLYWRGKLATTRWFLWAGVLTIPLPYMAALAGWVLSEVGRQPWIVWGLLKTVDANSPSVSTATIATSLGTFVVLYVALLIVDFVLMRRYARVDPPEVGGEGDEFGRPAVTY